jgi:uroporphyrinogen-III synthase
MAKPDFNGARVLALESRRAAEIETLISKLGGKCLLAPSLREVPLESNTGALRFAAALIDGQFDVVAFLTGVGARALLGAIELHHPRDAFLAALARTRIAVRGPKPLSVMREWGVPVWVVAPEPNTWRELVTAMEARAAEQPIRGARIAVQEYGESNTELLNALESRGARVTPVPVYQWSLPEDVEPLKTAATELARGNVDVILLTSGVQFAHLWRIAEELHLEKEVRRELARSVIASIGPTTSQDLSRHGMTADIEASHPKMGILVTEAAARYAPLLHAKRAGNPSGPL